MFTTIIEASVWGIFQDGSLDVRIGEKNLSDDQISRSLIDPQELGRFQAIPPYVSGGVLAGQQGDVAGKVRWGKRPVRCGKLPLVRGRLQAN